MQHFQWVLSLDLKLQKSAKVCSHTIWCLDSYPSTTHTQMELRSAGCHALNIRCQCRWYFHDQVLMEKERDASYVIRCVFTESNRKRRTSSVEIKCYKRTRNLCKLILINDGGPRMPENIVKPNEDAMSLIQ